MRKKLLPLLLLLSVPVLAGTPIRRNSSYEQYIDRYKAIAIEEMRKYGIPASITLAQGLLESGAGQSDLSQKGNNHFGIKCHGWTGRTISHDDDRNGECFRAYDSPQQSFEDHSLFLARRERYQRLFSLSPTDYKGWANGLKACGYATNPRYAQNLINIIETYELHQYDAAPTSRVEATRVLGETAKPKKPKADLHPVKRYNDNYYVYARRGDTFSSLSKELGVSAAKLADYNEREENDALREGDIVYLKKKAKRAEQRFKSHPHVVGQGQSLYLVAQLYGVQLKSLVKMNKWLEKQGYQVRVGDKVKLY